MEGDAGTDQLNPTDADGVTEDSERAAETQASDTTPAIDASVEESADMARPSGLRRGALVLVGLSLVLIACGVAFAGYLALRSHAVNAATARADTVALAAAKDCIAATHAPDASAMSASQMKIIDCATGAFGTQATLYSGVLVDAYQAASVKVQVSDLRAAVEKNNPDGSVDVLVAVRTKISNTDTPGIEQGYRLRVNMVPIDGTYKIAKLDQVSS